MTDTEHLVSLRGLSRSFGEGRVRVEAVREVDLELDAGEIVLIMGPSGSGKTTLLSMLGGLLRPTAGALRVAGADVTGMSERQLAGFRARTFGFIFQDFNLVAALSARENIEVALNIAGRKGRDAHERAATLIDQLGLGLRADFPIDKLSGGEKQRVAIARALVNRPRLILADEPTANLDSHHGAETMRLLRGLVTDQQTAVVIVSHDERIREVADRVLWLEDGSLRPLANLVRDPTCGMLLEPERAAATLVRDGTTTYFCSKGCRDEFALIETRAETRSDLDTAGAALEVNPKEALE